MRVAPIALLSIVAIVAAAQDQPATLSGIRRIHTLTLVSNDLRGTDRDRIVRAFQGGTYSVDELAERVRDKLRERGYALVEVDTPQITCVRSAQSKCDADVRLMVRAGDQYRLGEIAFTLSPATRFFLPINSAHNFPFNVERSLTQLQSAKDSKT
ncbi:MAG: hypothetical protein Q8902_15885 [Bacteroidota bacterium]|nr:hypothetical protein [Bacteroidota bacterium]